MRLIIVRHGETHHNRKRRIQGHLDSKLSARGVSQAKKLAFRLRNEKIDAAFCSDLSRAQRTAREIMKFHKGVPLIVAKELREKSYGIFEGMHEIEFRKIRGEKGIPRHLFRPRGGESFRDVKTRVSLFLDAVRKKYKNRTVLIVAHGGANRVLLGILMKKQLKEAVELEQKNACVNIAEIKGGKITMHRVNCTKHL